MSSRYFFPQTVIIVKAPRFRPQKASINTLKDVYVQTLNPNIICLISLTTKVGKKKKRTRFMVLDIH